MRLGKKEYYSTPAKQYPDKDYRVLIYNLKEEPKYNHTIIFTKDDLEKLVIDHLKNEEFNDKKLQRKYSDFWKLLNKLKRTLDKLELEHSSANMPDESVI